MPSGSQQRARERGNDGVRSCASPLGLQSTCRPRSAPFNRSTASCARLRDTFLPRVMTRAASRGRALYRPRRPPIVAIVRRTAAPLAAHAVVAADLAGERTPRRQRRPPRPARARVAGGRPACAHALACRVVSLVVGDSLIAPARVAARLAALVCVAVCLASPAFPVPPGSKPTPVVSTASRPPAGTR